MNIFVFCAHWDNRGDEAAVRAMLDEIQKKYPDANIRMHNNMVIHEFPYENIPHDVKLFYRPAGRNKLRLIPYWITIFSGGKINLLHASQKEAIKSMIEAIDWADLALYAPGGPNIGDYYRQYVMIDVMELMYRRKTPYAFFAPSMGPFTSRRGRIRKMLQRAEFVCLREAVSQSYVNELAPDVDAHVTLDSAFQHPVDTDKYEKQYLKYASLKDYMGKYDRVVGITITDLLWHRNYHGPNAMDAVIKESFTKFVQHLTNQGFGVIFIPQLFGNSSDRTYMSSFGNEHCFTVDDQHDCYFQQYLISKLYAVVGMRYHSNIFSAKMGTPFISVAYEHKMTGFMEKIHREDYCIPVKDLSADILQHKFALLEEHYDQYKCQLTEEGPIRQKEAYQTTEYVIETIEKLQLN